MAVLPIILGVAAVGTVIALLAGGSAKASTGGGTVPPGGTPPGSRQRVIDSSTGTPGAFATKYGGAFSKWKEIPDANPGVHIVYKQNDPDTGELVWLSSPPASPGVIIDEGLSPWSIGQTVNLPAGWPG